MGFSQLVGSLGVASGARNVLKLLLIGGVVVGGEELGEHLRSLVPGGVRYLQAVTEEVRDALDTARGAGAGQLLELDGDPAVPEAVAVGDAKLGGIVAIAPEAQGGVEGEEVAPELAVLVGPCRRRRRRRGR